MCKKGISLFAAATLVVGSYSMAATPGDPMDNTATPAAGGSPTAQQGGTNSPEDMSAGAIVGDRSQLSNAARVSGQDATNVRTELGRITTDALSDSSLSDIRQDVSAKDQDRLTDNVKVNDLKSVSDQIKQAWHDKYHDDFHMPPITNAFTQVAIYQGDLMNDQAVMAGLKMLPSQGLDQNTNGDTAPRGGSAGSTGTSPRAGEGISEDADLKLVQSDGNMATAVYPVGRQLPALVVPLINEGTRHNKDWKVFLPEEVDTQRLHDNLLRELTMVKNHQDRWSDDQNKEFETISHHVLAALENVQPTNVGDSAQKAGLEMRNTGDAAPNGSPNNVPGSGNNPSH